MADAANLFRHRQTMAGAVRFSTDELAELASRIAEAAEQRPGAGNCAVRRDGARWRWNCATPSADAAGALAALDVAVGAGANWRWRRVSAPGDRRWPRLQDRCAAAIRWWKRRWRAANARGLCAQ